MRSVAKSHNSKRQKQQKQDAPESNWEPGTLRVLIEYRMNKHGHRTVRNGTAMKIESVSTLPIGLEVDLQEVSQKLVSIEAGWATPFEIS